MIKEVNQDQVKMKNEKNDKNNKTRFITSPNVVKTAMLILPIIKTTDTLRYFPSFSCLSLYNSNYMQYFLEKVGNIFQNSSKALHLIKKFSHQIPFCTGQTSVIGLRERHRTSVD